MTPTHSEQQSGIELSAQEILEISQEINQKFAPNLETIKPETVPFNNLYNSSASFELAEHKTSAFFQSKLNPEIKLLAEEILEISQTISQEFAPDPPVACKKDAVLLNNKPSDLSTPLEVDVNQPDTAFQSKHDSTVALLANEILEISQAISKEFAPSILSSNSTELALLPVDPFHVYAYWNLDANPPAPVTKQETEHPLVLRVYWQADENTTITNTKLWFDLPVDDIQPRQKVRLPIDGTAYSAVIGRLYADNSLTVLTHSNVAHVPANNMKPRPVFFGAESRLDIADLPSQINVFSPEKTIPATLAYYDDPALIGWKYKSNDLENSFILKNRLHPKQFAHAWSNRTASGQGK
jgi:hypothetical protein